MPQRRQHVQLPTQRHFREQLRLRFNQARYHRAGRFKHQVHEHVLKRPSTPRQRAEAQGRKGEERQGRPQKVEGAPSILFC